MTKEELLAFEKEVLGIYISGHPLEKYEDHVAEKHYCRDQRISSSMRRRNMRQVQDGDPAVIGGMITAKTVKYTQERTSSWPL